MSARQRMTMRATIERNIVVAKDAYGHEGPPEWSEIESDVPCYVWKGGAVGHRTDSRDDRTVTVGMPGAIFPLDTDIDINDRLNYVNDRRGNILFNEMYVDFVLRRHDHLGVGLREYA